MMNIKELNRAVVGKVRTALEGTEFEGIQIDSEDISSNVKPNTLKIFFDANYSQEMGQRVVTVEVEIFYYARDTRKYKIDCLNMQDILQDALLQGIETDDEFIAIEGLEFDIASKTLGCAFEFTYKYVTLSDEDAEPIEELEWR